jgi:hypothetical protein
MKKTKILLFAFMLLNLVMASLVVAAPPPTEVLEFKDKSSPLHVIGEVEEDVLLKEDSEERGYSSQIRTMQLRIDKIIKKPSNLGLKSGELLNIVYSYVPSWVLMEGGAKMDIVVGDQIEIWLKLGDKGWEPAFGGETVDHVKYMEPRKEPIPEPIHNRVQRNIEGNLELVIFGGLVFILLVMVVLQKFFWKN